MQALELLEAVSTPYGFLASKSDIDNYRRIWARDGVICGLAALLSGHEGLISTFRAHLQTLAAHQTDLGHIPSNVLIEQGEAKEVSLGGLCGRADTIAWFVIGVCNYAHFTGDKAFAQQMRPHIALGCRLMQAWEFNNKGLMYVPRSGDWADEYVLHGYVLYDQLLRLWALKSLYSVFHDEQAKQQAHALQQLLELNYWHHPSATGLYHANAMQKATAPLGTYWLAAFHPGGYQTQFDAWANALALLLPIGSMQQIENTASYAWDLLQQQHLHLLPAFWPPIQAGDKEWEALESNHKYAFRNHPYEFHNAGSWPVVNGFWGMALASQGRKEEAKELLHAINTANHLSDDGGQWGFFENFHTKTKAPIGTKYCAWSAAAPIMVQAYLDGKRLV